MKTPRPPRFEIFGFTHTPFLKPLDLPFLDDPRKKALDRLQDFLQYRGFAVVAGPPGCGKTLLLHHLAATLHPQTHKILYIPFSLLSESDMLRTLCYEFDLQPQFTKSAMLRNLQQRIRELYPVNPLLVLDEIQKISPPTLELIRLLANFQFDGKNYLSILLAGAPQFLQQLKLRIHEPLRQRITLFVTLLPLERAQTPHYIRHHFAAAGAHQEILSDPAANKIHDLSGGIPRLINHLTLAALKEAAEQQSPVLDLHHVENAMATVVLPKLEAQP